MRSPPVLPMTLTAHIVDSGNAGIGQSYFTSDNDLVIPGLLAYQADEPASWISDEAAPFWMVLRRVAGSWQRTSYGFTAPPPAEAMPSPAIPFSLGAVLTGGGKQLLAGGKAVKLPSKLKQGIVSFHGPWS